MDFLWNDHIGPLIMLTVEPRRVNHFWAHSPISYKYMSFCCLILRSTPNHIPLTYRCLFNKWKGAQSFLYPCWNSRINYDMGFSRWRLKLESIGIAVKRLWLCATMELLLNLYLRFVHYTRLLLQHAWVSTFELTFQLLSNICSMSHCFFSFSGTETYSRRGDWWSSVEPH